LVPALEAVIVIVPTASPVPSGVTLRMVTVRSAAEAGDAMAAKTSVRLSAAPIECFMVSLLFAFDATVIRTPQQSVAT
jgi:hypothetical protein